MKGNRKLNRRSFVARVTGGIAIGALAVIGRPARAFQTGWTDQDSGAYADSACYGRGGPGSRACQNYSGYTDNDPHDAEGAGRNPNIPTGVTDSDSGPHADNANYGRGGAGSRTAQPYTGITDNDSSDATNAGRGRAYTGITDSDTGSSADAGGYGRGTHTCTDSDPLPPSGDPVGSGRNC